MRMNLLAAFALLAVLATPAAAQVTQYDDNPDVAFTYGTGNGYNPANAVTLTTNPSSTRTDPLPGGELALRAHVPTVAAASTGGTGIYTFALGSDVSFDFSTFGSALAGSSLTITNLLTGDDATFAAALLGTLQPSTAIQGSQQLGFGFLNGSIFASENIHFDNMINNTYRIDLSGGGNTISAFAQLGSGAVAAVPEPATWAMMLIGFGGMGVALRRRKRATQLTQMA